MAPRKPHSKEKTKALTKAEIIAEQVAETVGAGRELHLESVDFSDPNRPKTCLEVDFPILPINEIAKIESTSGAGRKPIYTMSKWWARRASSVFRSTLIAAATKAPNEPAEAAKQVWDSYYGNHQKNEAFRKLKVADIFMGGGTTLVEGARLGMQMVGNDLNPVAWLVVKNELSDVNLEEVNKLFEHIEREVKHQIMPFYACEGPNGEKGVWTHLPSGKIMDDDFDPLALKPEERNDYSYEGPEVIYTFWGKHGPCAAPDCGHRTPLMSSPVVAMKTLSVKTWMDTPCSNCQESFDIERQEARMAPDVPLVVADTEAPYAIMDDQGYYTCPHCQHRHQDAVAAVKGESSRLVKKSRKNKKVELTLLVHPDWLKGAPGQDEQGPLGGTATSDVAATQRWNELRASTLKLVEVRGKLSEEVTCPETGKTFSTSEGTIPKKSNFTCQENTCGRQQGVLSSIRTSGETGPIAAYALQCISPKRKNSSAPYNGRFFKALSSEDIRRQNAAIWEWKGRSQSDLEKYWPKSELPYGFMTHLNNGGIPNHGYTHWYKMFNERQLLVLSLLLKAIDTAYEFSQNSKEFVLGTFLRFLQHQNMLCFWDSKQDCVAPSLSNSNFHPKSTLVENSTFLNIGRGNWNSSKQSSLDAINWKNNPRELVINERLINERPLLSDLLKGKSEKIPIGDQILTGSQIFCESSTELKNLEDKTIDLVVTDPPFGGLLHYAELADFFYVWIRLILAKVYPQFFAGEYTPKTLEAVSNKASPNISPNQARSSGSQVVG